MNYYKKVNISTKPLSISDDLFIFKSRNKYLKDKIFLIQKEKLSYPDHKKWLRSFVKNNQNKGFIFYLKKKKIGFILLKKVSFYYEITIIFEKKYINKGFGRIAYNETIKKLKNNTMIVANIHAQNLKSLNYFKKMNFIKLYQDKSQIKLAKIEILTKKNKIQYIKKIEKILGKNNSNWMDLLKLSISLNQSETIKIMNNIHSKDEEISKVLKEMITKN